jgi:hypothetical protein
VDRQPKMPIVASIVYGPARHIASTKSAMSTSLRRTLEMRSSASGLLPLNGLGGGGNHTMAVDVVGKCQGSPFLSPRGAVLALGLYGLSEKPCTTYTGSLF